MKQYWRCPACGGAIPPEADFCPLCGAKLKKKETAAPAPKPAPSSAPVSAPGKTTFNAAEARRAIVAAEILSSPVSKRRR